MKIGIRELVFIALVTCIPLASWWLAFRPANAQCAEMRKEIQAKQERLRELNRATGTIGDLKRRIDKLEKAMAYFRSKLPSEKEIDKVLQEIWRLAEANQLQAKSIRTLDRNKGVQQVGDHCEQPIAVQLGGNFMGFYAFLQALENQPRIMRIHKMSLSRPPKGPEGDLQAEFNMTIFFEGTPSDKEKR